MKLGFGWPVLLGLVVTACDCGGDPGLGRLEPRLEVEVESVDFGPVPIGATRLLTLGLRNTGTAVLTVDMAGAVLPFGVSSQAFDVPAGDEVLLELSFAPAMLGAATSTLTVTSNDREQPSLIIPLSGEGIEGTLIAFPTELDLTATKVGAVRSAEVVLQNNSLTDVTGALTILGFERSEHFELPLDASAERAGPFTVPPGGDETLEVVYRPLESGDDRGRLMFETCGSLCGILVHVRASAIRANLILDPPRLDFGEVPLGQSVTLPLSMRNEGEESITVTAASASGGGELSVVVNSDLPLTIAPGASASASVELNTTVAGAYEGEVRIDVSPTGERLRAFVSATAVGPRFEVAPEIINFGIVRESAVVRRQAILINAGSAQIEVQSVRLTGATEFAIEDLLTPPLVIGPGESVVVSLSFMPPGIGEYNATLEIQSNDPVEPVVEIPVIGAMADQICELEAMPARIGFGYVPHSFSRSLSMRVSNVGTDTCTLLQGDFRAPLEPSFVASSPSFPLTLAPGQSLQLPFTYTPQTRAVHKANYILTTDDPVFPEHPLSLNGTSLPYDDILVIPEVVDLGTTAVGCAPRLGAFTVYNTGIESIDFFPTTFTATTTEITFNEPQHPYTLAPGGAQSVTLRYEPLAVGRDSGYALVTPMGRPNAIVVPAFANTGSMPSATDVFQQRVNNRVDVLFVVDNSCSMGNDQQNLASNFMSFIQQAGLRQVDFQIGVTTTDVFRNPGVLVGPVLNSNTPGLEGAFSSQVNVGINGSGHEQGLEALSQALKRADEGVANNRDLFRRGAAFVGVYVSDEEDQSPFPVTNYFQELTARFGANMVMAAVAEDQNCGNSRPSQRYFDMTSLSGGVFESICSSWATALANVGQAAFGLRSGFPLSQPAVSAASIQVFVDGVFVTAWTYDSASNTVTLTTPPPEGATVEINYTPQC